MKCLGVKLLPMTHRSTLYRLLEKQLGASLSDYVTSRRPAQSWRAIAAELSDAIGVEVTHESLRNWFAEAEESAA